MKISTLRRKLVFASLLMVWYAAACSTSTLSPSTPIAQPPQSQTGSAPTAPNSAVSTLGAPPTPSYPLDWESFQGGAIPILLFHPPTWTATFVNYHVEIKSPSGIAWADIDWLSPDNPDMAGELLASGADISQLSQKLESALQDNGTFGESESFTTSGGASAWLIEGYDLSYNDNLVVALVSSGEKTIQFVGHQGDPSEDWPSLKEIFRQMIATISL